MINYSCLGVIAAVMTLAMAPSASWAAPGGQVNSGAVSMRITVDAPSKESKVRLWAPYPVSDSHQKIENVKVEGNYTLQKITTDPISGSQTLYAEWTAPAGGERYLVLSFHAASSERKAGPPPAQEPKLPAEVMEYTKATALIPTDGEIGQIAAVAVEGLTSVAQKHEAIYSWVVRNTFRDPNVIGCGVGVVEKTLAKRGGKCADISTVYVSLARAAGIPAREVFGMRLGTEPGQSDITGGHHCWAEYFQPGYGWTQTDPADVRKIMLAKNLTLDQAGAERSFYLNGVDADRIVLDKLGRGITLNPPQQGGPLNYLMYPYAEVDGEPVEWLAAQKQLKYTITFVKD
ncbi:MAG: transglutaminase-like domain-containing protein [Nitrospinota bacterium]|nr:transglutaminase-like domain-containing protein [Nitrospinota bacterium]